ncbi:MAG: hypothetical protein ABIQ55_10890 [Gemmatimonadaceae bacterium]
MPRLLDKIPVPIRAAAWHAINRMPRPVQRLFPHTDEYRRWKMEKLYDLAPTPAPGAPTVLFWVPGGMHVLLHVETVIAAALKFRGYNVHAIICDAPYVACVRREVTDGVPLENWRDLCASCIASNRSVLNIMGIPYSSIGDFVSQERREELRKRAEPVNSKNVRSLEYQGLDIGNNVWSTITRFLQGEELGDRDDIVREYAYSAMVTAEAGSKVLDRFKPDRVFMSHGTYVDWGPALHTAMGRGIPVTGWKASYLTSRFFFRHVLDASRVDFHKLSDKVWADLSSKPLTEDEDESLRTFLARRYHQGVSFDMKRMAKYTGETEAFRQKYNLDPNKPIWGVLAHINWDSVSDYSPMAYASFDEWMVDTIETVSQNTDVQWLIKVHPIEAYDNPAAGVQRLIDVRFPNLPPHVHVIPAEEQISPLEFFAVVDGAVTVYGTAGLELALQGKPVILAGEAHYGGKGFTYDGLTIDAYRTLLQYAPVLRALDGQQIQLARTYGHSYFIQRQIPLPLVRDPNSIWWNLQHDRRDQLLPGADPFLDFICEKLMKGEDFVMNRKLVELADSDVWA